MMTIRTIDQIAGRAITSASVPLGW